MRQLKDGLSSLAWKSDIKESYYGLHQTRVLAVVDKVFETGHVLWVPFKGINVSQTRYRARPRPFMTCCIISTIVCLQGS